MDLETVLFLCPIHSTEKSRKDGARGFVRAHPSHKNKDVARLGHLKLLSQRAEGGDPCAQQRDFVVGLQDFQ